MKGMSKFRNDDPVPVNQKSKNFDRLPRSSSHSAKFQVIPIRGVCFNSAFLMSFCLRVVPRFGGNVNINKPLAACKGTSTQYMLFSAINGRVLVLIYIKSFHLISALETWNATLRHICLHYSVLCLRVVLRFRLLMNIR